MTRRTLAIARASAVIGGMGALIVGATFAATNVGTVALAGNSFTTTATTSAGLQISSDGNAFADSATGFNFGNLTVGTDGAKQNLWLEDTSGGSSPLGISLAAANVSTLSGVDPTDVVVNIEKQGGSQVDSSTLADLETGTLNLSTANEPAIESSNAPVPTEYQVWLTLTAAGSPSPSASPDASPSPSPTVSPSPSVSPSASPTGSNTFDLSFTGTSS